MSYIRKCETLVKEDVSKGANAIIVCGHTIGRYATVAAGVAGMKDVPDYCLVSGVLARVAGRVYEEGNRIE